MASVGGRHYGGGVAREKRQKEPKTPAELYNLFHQGDHQIGPWLDSLDTDTDMALLHLLGGMLGKPVVLFERRYAAFYAQYLLAEVDSQEEFAMFAITHMAGYEYENFYRKQLKFLSESVTAAMQEDVDSVFEGRYYSPSDPAMASPTTRLRTYELKRVDPRQVLGCEQSAASFEYRTTSYCESCCETEQHDVWKIIAGTFVGLHLTAARKHGTFGKLGKRSLRRICARCQFVEDLP